MAKSAITRGFYAYYGVAFPGLPSFCASPSVSADIFSRTFSVSNFVLDSGSRASRSIVLNDIQAMDYMRRAIGKESGLRDCHPAPSGNRPEVFISACRTNPVRSMS
jgi:hypothetical protein